jgi:hypothetical protein
MSAQILSALIAPHSYKCVAVLLLVLVFLIIEIPLVFSIFKKESKDEDSKKTDK